MRRINYAVCVGTTQCFISNIHFDISNWTASSENGHSSNIMVTIWWSKIIINSKTECLQADVDVFISNYTIIDPEIYQLWIEGFSCKFSSPNCNLVSCQTAPSIYNYSQRGGVLSETEGFWSLHGRSQRPDCIGCTGSLPHLFPDWTIPKRTHQTDGAILLPAGATNAWPYHREVLFHRWCGGSRNSWQEAVVPLPQGPRRGGREDVRQAKISSVGKFGRYLGRVESNIFQLLLQPTIWQRKTHF